MSDDVKKMKRELVRVREENEYLKHFVDLACFGSPRGEITDDINRDFIDRFGRLPPNRWAYWSNGNAMELREIREDDDDET